MEFVALDILSPPVMKPLADNFTNDMSVKIVKHGLDDDQLPDMEYFGAF